MKSKELTYGTAAILKKAAAKDIAEVVNDTMPSDCQETFRFTGSEKSWSDAICEIQFYSVEAKRFDASITPFGVMDVRVVFEGELFVIGAPVLPF